MHVMIRRCRHLRSHLRARLIRPTIGTRERGAVAIMVGVALVGLIGFAAYVIDIGAVYEERRDLQNGADAAALQAAQDCAQGINCTPAQAQGPAETIASLNANDGQATVNASDIVFDLAAGEVTVTAHTRDATDGDGSINFALGAVLGSDSKAVSAQATAWWYVPGSGFAIPITFSSCEWDILTSGGTNYGVYSIIYLHDDNVTSGGSGSGGSTPPQCANGPGQDVDGDGDRNEGGFGYLDSSNCSAFISVDGYVTGQTGAGNPGSLGCTLGDIRGQELLVPIFDDIPDVGNPCGAPPGQPCYHIMGFAVFEVVDVDLTGGGWNNQGNICAANQRCLGGMFKDTLSLDEGLAVYGGGGSGPPDMGVVVVGLSG